jgi:hypothetical protein
MGYVSTSGKRVERISKDNHAHMMVAVTPAQKEKFGQIACKQGATKSSLLRLLIEDFLAKYED